MFEVEFKIPHQRFSQGAWNVLHIAEVEGGRYDKFAVVWEDSIASKDLCV